MSEIQSAEELAQQIEDSALREIENWEWDGENETCHVDHGIDIDKAAALIDDFARTVLERAAERFRKKYFSLVATEEYEDDEIADMWNLYITEHCCSAILSPEED